MSNHTPFSAADFPPRRSEHGGRWAPLYLEPLVGSGERICIGVLAEDQNSTAVLPVPDIERLACVYGDAAHGFAWAARLAIMEIEHRAEKGGVQAVSTWEHGIEGLTIGPSRLGAGTDLHDLANVALRQVSSLALPQLELRPDAAHALVDFGKAQRLDLQVRRIVTERRPELRERFGTVYRPSQSARPLKFGYVGSVLVANFATLTATSTNTTSAQVDRAKARLWDLQQLQSGVLADSLKLNPRSMSYELLVHRPQSEVTRGVSDVARALKEAEAELEAESDKFEIRFRPMHSPQQIARYIVEREAA